MRSLPPMFVAIALAAVGVLSPRSADAQQNCKLLFCSPTLLFQPATITTNAVDPPEVRLANGTTTELERSTEFLMRFTLMVPTSIPRTSLSAHLQWTPFADAPRQPFTGQSAEDLGEEAIDANLPLFVYGPVFKLVTEQQTNGWFSGQIMVRALFSPGMRPEDERAYTHKFLPGLGVNVGIFNWLPEGSLLRNVPLFARANYVATGLPEAGDPVPGGGTLLDDADPWILIFGMGFPLAPTPIAR